MLFQTELYVGFSEKYTHVRDKFYSFPILKAQLGVEFSNLNDALYFKKLVDRFSFKGEPGKVVKEEKKKYGTAAYRLTAPLTFKRKQQDGWNPVTQTFSIKDCPKEFIALITKAGFKKKHLKKPETALYIYEYLLNNPDFEADMLTKEPEQEAVESIKPAPRELNESKASSGGSMMSKQLQTALSNKIRQTLNEQG